ncbi:type 4a pilus biogenesis protein PilO [Candidatus Peregrinibacteria bacterium]|nr:type 4a pilus biogenesis protein PilO [Candidatus Peregrinibacteria bacterium]
MKKTRIFTLFLLLVIVALWVFYIRPVQTKIDSLTAQRDERQKEIQELEKQAQELEALKISFPEDKASRQLILAQVPAQSEQDRIVRLFDTLASRFHITFQDMNFTLGEDFIEGVAILSISSSFQGSFSDLLAFLKALEEEHRIIRVKTMQIERHDDGSSTFHLRMESYYQSS